MCSDKLIFALAACIILPAAGCATEPARHYQPPEAASRILVEEMPALSESLFPADQEVMGNEAIAQILASPVYLPEPTRLAVVRFGDLPNWWSFSPEFARTSERLDDDFLDRLRESDRLDKVAYLPSLVTPGRMTIPHLRESAVRFQSDALLVYRTTTGSYRNYRFLRSDEVRSYCTVEAVLLDVRTGTIPFSTVVTERFEARKERDDKNFEETVTKATQEAMGRAWLQLADETVDYLATAPTAADEGH